MLGEMIFGSFYVEVSRGTVSHPTPRGEREVVLPEREVKWTCIRPG